MDTGMSDRTVLLGEFFINNAIIVETGLVHPLVVHVVFGALDEAVHDVVLESVHHQGENEQHKAHL